MPNSALYRNNPDPIKRAIYWLRQASLQDTEHTEEYYKLIDDLWPLREDARMTNVTVVNEQTPTAEKPKPKYSVTIYGPRDDSIDTEDYVDEVTLYNKNSPGDSRAWTRPDSGRIMYINAESPEIVAFVVKREFVGNASQVETRRACSMCGGTGLDSDSSDRAPGYYIGRPPCARCGGTGNEPAYR